MRLATARLAGVSACVFLSILALVPYDVQAQSGTLPDDYYLWQYYYGPPPPKEVKVIVEDTVRQTVTQGGTNRIARNFRKITKISKVGKTSRASRGSVFRPRNGAGALFDSSSFAMDYSIADVTDELLVGDGTDQDVSFLYSGTIGDSYSISLGYANNRYKIDSYEQQTDAIDLYANWFVNDAWALGIFVGTSWVDVEESYKIDPVTLTLTNLADSFSVWGAGLLVSYSVSVGEKTSMGITNTITTTNKKSMARYFDDEDSAWLLMLDLNHALNDDWSLYAFGTMFHLLDRQPEQADGSYGIIGFDVSYRVSKSWSASIGYDTSIADNDRDEHRLNLSFVCEF